jgi:glycerol-3-phosphate acyltransferase PlsY
MKEVLLILLGYLSGSVLFGELVAKVKGVNIREVGSGNVGATNVGRALGRRYALLVFLLDSLKGFLPAYLGLKVLLLEGIPAVLVGMAPVVGHMFPVFSGFKGGKGVATAFGVLTAVSPGVALLSLCLWAVMVAVTRYVSVGSMVASSFAPVFLLIAGYPPHLVVLGLLVALLIVLRHSSNIRRLLRGEEHRV